MNFLLLCGLRGVWKVPQTPEMETSTGFGPCPTKEEGK